MTDSDRWKENMSGRERVLMVIETLDKPATITEIADKADVAWATAKKEIQHLIKQNQVEKHDVDGETKYGPNPVQQFFNQILELIRRNTRNELEETLVEHQSQIESLQEEHGFESSDGYREQIAEKELSTEEIREIRNIADTWQALETEKRLIKHALNLYDDVSRISDSENLESQLA